MKQSKVFIVFMVYCQPLICLPSATDPSLPDLPLEHLTRYLNTFPKQKAACEQHHGCSELYLMNSTNGQLATDIANACWGHEVHCTAANRFQTPVCVGPAAGRIQNKEIQVETFYSQADFGYVKRQINDLRVICEPTFLTDSALVCTEYLRFCRGRNLLLDLRDLPQRSDRIRYHTDVLQDGQIKGYCKLNRSLLDNQIDHMGALQSWSAELRNFAEATESLYDNKKECDLFIQRPAYLMKIDATYNMYHHFCDFFNLYVTLFVNQSHPTVFDTNSQIIIWETYPYDSPFAVTFKAFSQHPIWTLSQIQGRKVCFQNVVLPLLPRMIFGLYYNTPIIQGCQNSGLFRAFSEFILHRLKIPFEAPTKQIRITFISRSTKYRRVLNEDILIDEISKNENYLVTRISYERVSNFTKQLDITRNTDILIGMHGAGLTHLLFLPNWAAIFELYNCEDPNCYRDLARLRGVYYITWENKLLVYPQDQGHHPEGGAHAKFTNYSFDSKEFVRLVEKAANHIRSHNDYLKFTETSNSLPQINAINQIKDEL